MFVFLFPANVGFIGFDDAPQKASYVVEVVVVGAGFADALEHKPSGCLGDSKFLGKLYRGNAFPCGHDLIDGEQPFVQRDM